MRDDPDEPLVDELEQVSDLLAEVLATPAASQPEELARLCAEHPAIATALRHGYEALRQLELVSIGTGAATEPSSLDVRDWSLPCTFGNFRLLEFLGAGGMSSVYRAEDLELGRPVALKFIRSDLLVRDRARSRFQREAAALARLEHPGLCTVYRAGTTDGQPWIAMRLVRGITLAGRIQRASEAEAPHASSGAERRRGSSHAREDLPRTLLCFEKIARALATAHQAGLVHRDIKPANIVLTSDDEPVVIDFGLAHLDDSESQLTLSGDRVGTPAYMAPEQIATTGKTITPATDVYALGVTLFETLTGRSPFAAHTREELFAHIVSGDRLRLRQALRALPRDLEIVVEKALDVDPARRYPDMVAFADDLRRVRQHESPAARRPGLALRTRRWCQRNPVAATVLGLLTTGLAVGIAMDASRQAARERSLAMAYGNLAGQVLEKSPEHALALALRGVDHAPDDPETLGMLLGAMQEVHERQQCKLPWPTHPTYRVQRVIPSPRGDAALVLAQHSPRTFPTAALWNRTTCRALPIEKGTLDAQWTADGDRFLTTAPEQAPQLWTASGEPLHLDWPPPNAPPTLRCPRARFLAGDTAIVFACFDGIARIHRLDTDTWIELSPGMGRKRPGMPGLAVSADGRRLALGDNDGRIVVHEVEDALQGKEGRVLTSEGLQATELDLGPAGRYLQVRSYNPNTCQLWTWEGKRLRAWGRVGAPADAAPLDPFVDRFVEAAKGHMPRCWGLVDGELEFLHEICEHEGQINDFSFGSGGRILSVGVDGTARVANLDTGATELRLRGFDQVLQAGAFLPDGRRLLLATASHLHCVEMAPVTGTHLPVDAFADKWAEFAGPEWHGAILTADVARTLSLHDPEHHTVRRVQEERFLRRSVLRMSADGHWLASASMGTDGQTILNVYGPGLERTHTVDELGMEKPEVVFGPANELLLVDTSTPEDGTCALHLPVAPGAWEPAPDAVRQQFTTACAGATAVAFHAGSSTLAVAREQRGVTLYHWQNAPPTLQQGPSLALRHSPRTIAFSPDGERLLLACTDRVVRSVCREDSTPVKFEGHLGTLVSVEFSPDGQRLLIAASDSGVTVHDLEGKLLLACQPTGSMAFARFMPAGDRLLYGDTNRTTRIVPFEREEILRLARGVAVPPMSAAQDRHYRARAGDDSDL